MSTIDVAGFDPRFLLFEFISGFLLRPRQALLESCMLYQASQYSIRILSRLCDAQKFIALQSGDDSDDWALQGPKDISSSKGSCPQRINKSSFLQFRMPVILAAPNHPSHPNKVGQFEAKKSGSSTFEWKSMVINGNHSSRWRWSANSWISSNPTIAQCPG